MKTDDTTVIDTTSHPHPIIAVTIDKLLKQLSKTFPNVPHLYHSGKPLTQEEWVSQGKPFYWETVENTRSIRLMTDSSYGYIAIFKDDVLEDISMSIVMTKDGSVIGLDTNYGIDRATLYFKESADVS